MWLFDLTTMALTASLHSQNAGPVIPWVRILLAFFFCIAFAACAILWLRMRQTSFHNARSLFSQLRLIRQTDGESLEIENRLRTTATGQFVILRCGARRYLVHHSPHGAQMIDRLDDQVPADPVQ